VNTSNAPDADIYVVGTPTVATQAIARSVAVPPVSVACVSAHAAALALDRGRPSAIVLIPGPALDAGILLSALLRRPATPFIIVTAASPPPLGGGLRPTIVSTLDELRSTVRALVKPTTEQSLTARHVEVLEQLARGYTPAEAADQLGITVKTFNNHLGVVYRRLGTPNVTQAVLAAVRQGIIELP
jgi:DNA-binding CsgD family transcriptional regulator